MTGPPKLAEALLARLLPEGERGEAVLGDLPSLRVIHGKGLRSADLPKLKLMTASALRKHSGVIAFASCRPVDGGTGATDALLKRRPAR